MDTSVKFAEFERFADRADATVHHIGRCNDVAAGLRLHQRLPDQHGDRFVVENDPVAKQAVVTVAGKGVERHVAQDADVGHFFLDRADGAADKIVGIERFAARLIAQFRVGVWEERDAGNAQFGRTLGLPYSLVDGQPLNTGHGRDGRACVVAIHHKQGPDQIVGREHVLTHHAARPFTAPVAAHADCKVQPLGRLHRGEPGAAFDRTAKFDRHQDTLPALF